jgi:cytidyltransferase-like protein
MRQGIVLSVGSFDPLHLGHIRHLKSASKLGFFLYVSVSPDEACRLKGRERPYFPAAERVEAVSALDCVDYVECSEPLDAIRKFQPEVYVKGPECRDHPTPRLEEEINLVRVYGGRVVYTEDSIYSSTALMSRLLRDLGI